MDDLISKSAAIEALKDAMCMTGYQSRAIDAVRFLPTIDAEPGRKDAVEAIKNESEEKSAEWILEESPYAEHEECVDGESHPRYVCSKCGFEAGFECDPDGFAGWQVKAKFCGNCGRPMKNGE